jgi:ATP-binding cassette subfamily B (MDR/TAP) protein 1
MSHGIHLSKTQCPSTTDERECMSRIPYASAIGSIMYAMIFTRPDISYAHSVTSRYQSDQVRVTGQWLKMFLST